MKRLFVDSDRCTGCGVCEMACAMAWYKESDRDKSAIRISAVDQGGFSVLVCDQCGVCMGMCSTMALSADDNGVVRLDKKACVGCLVCVGECLRGYMHYHDDVAAPFKCIACGICASKCPNGALLIANEGGVQHA